MVQCINLLRGNSMTPTLSTGIASASAISLISMTFFFLLAWLPTSLAKRQTYGRAYLLSNRDQTQLPPLPEWGERSLRAYENLKCYFPAYAVAVILLIFEGKSDTGITIAAIAYLVARLLHFIFYTSGIVSGRATAWFVGLVSNLYLLARAL
jgi:uncharacterized MAPEG superfamily protein